MSTIRNDTGTPEAGMGTRILLVEDDPGTQDLIRALCESRGDSVDAAADGFLGLRLLSERRHEIVLIDYHLPEMDGYALARLMRELARPEGRTRLVGITADRHGLASRRGADTLFDAILVKPLDPQTLFATLDRLMQPEPPAPPTESTDPAEALWRRRGLPGRPRALLCPVPSAAEAEAVAQAFVLAEAPAEADIVLVSDEAGLDGLRSLRADGLAGLLPAFDLTGRLGAACDGVFQVGDPESWTALARTSLAFAERRAALRPGACTAQDPKARLAALMAVADRGLRLAAGDEAPGSAYETGYARTTLMAAVLQMMEAGWLTCEPFAGGVAAALTESGRDAVIRGGEAAPRAIPLARRAADAAVGVAEAPRRWQAPKASETAPVSGATGADGSGRSSGQASALEAPAPVNLKRLHDLHALVGPRRIETLLARLSETLAGAFAPGSDRQAVAHQAHGLISTAGSLGFDRLARACRVLQEAVLAGDDETQSLHDAIQASVETRKLCAQGLGLMRAS